MRVREPLDVRSPVTPAAALADPSNHVGIVPAGESDLGIKRDTGPAW